MITCPNCSGNLKFHPGISMMSCSFCNSTFDPYDFDSKNKDGIEVKEYETTVFTCPECAGEIMSTDNEVTGFCPFCGASTIFYSRISKDLKPDYIIPFSKTKEECKRLYGEKAKRALFLPKEYKDPNYINGFRGIYVPYWSYNVSQKGGFRLTGEKSHRSGDYIITDHFDLTGDIDAFYNGVAYDASSSFSDDIAERIAPFNVKEKKEFTAGFLSGFYADTADVDKAVYSLSAEQFAVDQTASSIKAIPDFAGYEIKSDIKSCIQPNIDRVERMLYPVWFMSYRKNDRVCYATVNGQTGKVSADFPIDIKKYLAFVAVLAMVLFLLLNIFFTFKPTTVSLLTAILAAVTSLIIYVECINLKNRNMNKNDKGLNYQKSKQELDNMKKASAMDASGVGSAREESFLQKRAAKKQEEDIEGNPSLNIAWFTAPIAAVISFFTFCGQSINDVLHYAVNTFSSALIAVSLVYLIGQYNILASRPLPQFERKGGDDNA